MRMLAVLVRGRRLVTARLRTAVRRWWRSARVLPILGTVLKAGDRVWWYRTILRSGLVDSEYYAAQRGWKSATSRRAVLDYVTRGYRIGLSLNPLVDELITGRDLPEPARVPSLYAYLVSDRATVRINPWWNAPENARREDVAGGEDFLPPLEQAWADRSIIMRLAAGEHAFAASVEEYRRSALSAAHEWAAYRRDGATRWAEDRQASAEAEVTVVRFLQRQDRDFDKKLVQARGIATDVEMVIAAVDPDASQWISLALLTNQGVPWRRVYLRGGMTFADAFSDVVGGASGTTIVSVDPRTALTGMEIIELARSARRGHAVAPTSLAQDGTVEAMGAAPIDGAVYRILHGHPPEDLDGFDGDAVPVPLLFGRTFSIDRFDLAGGGGIHGSSRLEDLSRTLSEQDDRFILSVMTSIRATHYAPPYAFDERVENSRHDGGDASDVVIEVLRRAGFSLQEWDRGRSGEPVPVLTWVPPDVDALRWALKVCAPAGPAGDVWGDTHFAAGLAKALRRQGQTVVVDGFEARERATSYLDDVTLVIRGPYRIEPPPNGVRIEWIISHPDLITAEEVADFDLVFAASERWSARATRDFRTPISPLLECTDTDQFYPRGRERGSDIVFVGTARGIPRPSVVAPLRAGIPVRVYGPDWRTYIPASAIAATTIPNAELSERYETASLVLNDHWPAMRREGFMAMRPFDVVAAGGRVISEEVDGLAEIFENSVVTYSSEAHLIELLRKDPAEVFPADAELARIAQRIRTEHSFDVRAAELLEAARAKHRMPSEERG